MTQKEREREVRKRLYQYASYLKEVRQYEEDILYGTPKHDESGVRGTDISDPTGRAGVRLANMPKDIEAKRAWVEAIDEALVEMRELDDAHRLTYICTRVYGLDGRRHKRRVNRDMNIKIADEVHLSISALYLKLGMINKIVMYHATLRGLL